MPTDAEKTRVSNAIRDVLIESVDCVPAGSEPFVGWSSVLADRCADAALSPENTKEEE